MDRQPHRGVAATDAEEAELVERLRRDRDGAAFEALYRRSRRSIFVLCLHFLKDPAWAEDACHDVFLQAYERFDTLRGEHFTAWVRRIAANHCLNLVRQSGVRQRLAPAAASEPSVRSGHGAAVARQELAVAAELIRRLSPAQRSVFLLRHVEGLSHREIVEATGFDAEQVRSYLQNARRNFRLAWEARARAPLAEPTARRAGEPHA